MTGGPENLAPTRDTLRFLLQLHEAATETYAVALASLQCPDRAERVVELRSQHAVAAGTLRNELARLHDHDDVEGSGFLGMTATTVERLAGWFGPDASLVALRVGEIAVVGFLNEILDDVSLLPRIRRLIATELLPAAKRRTTALAVLTSDDPSALAS